MTRFVGAVGAMVVLFAGAWFGWTLFDRSAPVADAVIRIIPNSGLKPGSRFDIDVEVTYLRSCRADAHRWLYDAAGVRYVLATATLIPAAIGVQHSITTAAIPVDFAPGMGRYVSHVTYACNWAQRAFWEIAVPERTAFFYVAPTE